MYDNHGHFHQGDAGLDLFIAQEQTIKVGETALIKLQLACEPENNQPYLLMPRSSIAKTSLRLSNSIGLIDAGYRGEIMAAVDNIKNIPFALEVGQRLFQLVGMDGSEINFELVENLSTSSRGSGGFGMLSQNNEIGYSSPVQVPGTTWEDVSAGNYAMSATKTDGTLWMWGDNEIGQLGQNSPESSRVSSPVQVPGTWSTFGFNTAKKMSFGIK